MEKVKIGKIVSTHGIKGEIKILSGFEFKEKVFKIGTKLIVDDCEYEIKSYRVHKGFDMVTLNDYHDINEVLFLMKKDVFVDKSILEFSDNEILDEDLMKFDVITTDGRRGKILEIFYASPTNKVMRIDIGYEYLVPFNSPFMKKLDKKEKTILVEILEVK
jgi:16S rRNA processing protein RimM